MDHVGIRELRQNISSLVRQAGEGEDMVITVDGLPVAHLGPLRPPEPPSSIGELAARGELVLPSRSGTTASGVTITLSPGERMDRLIREVRGR